jgi:hypothetical protein
MAQRRSEKDDDQRPAPSIEEDRRMLDVLLGIDFRAAAVEAEQWIGQWPVATRDQFEAAVRDAHAAVLRSLRTEAVRHEGIATYRTGIKVVAAVIRCVNGHRCPHVGQLLPTHAFPAARVISCADCLPGFKPVFVVSDQRVRDHTDMICDLCLEEATTFWPVAIQLTDTVVHGDACGHCVEGG